MQMDWIMGLLGGLLIGTGGAVYLLINGRVMGASGILGGLIDGSGRASAAERIAFVLGVFAIPTVIVALSGTVETHATSNILVLIAAGLFVGIGTRMANGCTSGHGVCGISRLNFRGIVATVFYILAGGVTVLLFRHILGLI
jgi:uncharacterized membrane protein YedE/YeeE